MAEPTNVTGPPGTVAGTERTRFGIAPLDLLSEGQLVGGRYEVEGPIGEGGMGQVFAAHHRVINKRVAIKVMLPQVARHPEIAGRFLREAQAASGIQSPYVVDVLDFGELDSGAPYMVLEYAPGENLARRLEGRRPLSLCQVRTIATQICRGLQAAHDVGVVHRDLKPENISLEDQDGTLSIKILDFGVAKVADSLVETRLTVPGAVIGTPHYMAPEQCEGRAIDARSDIYALGVMLFEMTTGVPPFEGASPMEIIRQHMLVEPPSPATLCEDYPGDLDALILRCLAKDPDARPADMREVERCLDAIDLSADEALRPSRISRVDDTFAATTRTTTRLRKSTVRPPQDSVGVQLAVSAAMLGLIGALIYTASGIRLADDERLETSRAVTHAAAAAPPTPAAPTATVTTSASSKSKAPAAQRPRPRPRTAAKKATRPAPKPSRPTRRKKRSPKLDGIVDPWAP